MAERRAAADGKQLEDLVAIIEGLLLPNGFEVTKNRRVYNDHGTQVAEFDVEIRGKLGSGSIAWLIECRNRPGEGPAAGSWIEQLAGRRSRFNFNKVSAVSTTGFTEGAVDYAKTVGIDLRELEDVAPEMINWLRVRSVQSHEYKHWLNHANIEIDENEPPERVEALETALRGKRLNEPQFRNTQTGETISPAVAFMHAVNENPDLTAGLVPNESPKPLTIYVTYPRHDSHFVIDTVLGSVRINAIVYDGTVGIIENHLPLSQTAEYRSVGDDNPVAQTAAFTGSDFSMQLHRVNETGAIYFTARRHKQPSNEAPTMAEDDSNRRGTIE